MFDQVKPLMHVHCRLDRYSVNILLHK
jgi:hypothetical protein